MSEPLTNSNGTKTPCKVTFLTVMPSPYVQDTFAALASDGRLQLTVWYLEQVAPDTYWGEQEMPPYAEVLPGKWYDVLGARVHWNPGIRRKIQQSDADLFVVVGYIGLTNQVAMRTLNRQRRPWVFWGEVPGFQERGWLGKHLRRFLQRPLKQAAAIAGVGSRAVDAYKKIVGSSNDRCQYANIPYHCQLDHFVAEARNRTKSTKVRFLFCGQLIERKGVDILCRAFQRVLDAGHDVSLSLAGEGALRQSLAASIRTDYASRIRFLGFQSVDKLPEIFRDADVFVLPSLHDGWGVVINQALASGLPIIATTAVGAAVDLVANDQSGWVIPVQDEERLFQAMLNACVDRKQLIEKSNRALEVAARVSLPRAIEDWCSLIQSVVQPVK